jgi:hypothetical protein
MTRRNTAQPWPNLPPPADPAHRTSSEEPDGSLVDGIVYSESWSLRLRQHPLRGNPPATPGATLRRRMAPQLTPVGSSAPPLL